MTPSTSGRPPRSWTSSPRDDEGERSESLYSVDEERGDSFTSVLDLIRRFQNIEKPAGVIPSRGRTTVARTLGLQTEPSPALHLPPSDLLKALVDDVNSTLDRFIEEQTPDAFIPVTVKRQRRYYRTSEPVLAAPYAVPPGLVSLTLDKTTKPKKRLVTISHSLVPSFEAALAGAGEVVSWLDWWLSTMSKFVESLPEEARANFQRLVISCSKALKFLGSPTSPRDSLLADVRSTVPSEELSRLRHAPLPNSSALFPPGRLDTALNKASNDALVHKALHPPRIPRDSLRARADPRQPRLIPRIDQGLHRWSPGNSNRRDIAPPQPPRPEAKRTNPVRVSSPFASPPGGPATTMASEKGHPSAQPDQTAAPARVGNA